MGFWTHKGNYICSFYCSNVALLQNKSSSISAKKPDSKIFSSLPKEMATITASAPTSSAVRASLVQRAAAPVGVSSPILGLPSMAKKGRVSCSMEERPSKAAQGSNMGMGASLLAAAAAATVSSPAMALVDERMSTEGVGLPFGLSNNLLGWILLGVFGLIWTFYITYTSSLEEDEESGLSL